MMEEVSATELNRLIQNNVVQPLLTDLYQIKIAYSYWKAGKTEDLAVFDLFFRKNPFHGEFTIFAGLNDCLNFIKHFKFSKSDIDYIKSILPQTVESEFFNYLSQLTTKDVTIYALNEGSLVFPRVPLLKVEGPLVIVQFLETTLLNLINYSSLITTNAARFRIVAGDSVKLFEFGLRRAQGPDGGLSASKYSYIGILFICVYSRSSNIGGFDGTSNVLAGKLFKIPIKGTMTHAFVSSFSGLSDIGPKNLIHRSKEYSKDFLQLCLDWRNKLSMFLKIMVSEVSDTELLAFISYAFAFPNDFIALVDTYDVLRSGLINFCTVALALMDMDYMAIGIRIDSGDLAYLSNKAREVFTNIGREYHIPWFENLMIIASNDINEETIQSINEQNHQIDVFGIGTHLVTCQKQPALGCVYKLVEINGHPKIKLSEDIEKISIPGKKNAFRLFAADGMAICDLLQCSSEHAPVAGKSVLCRHPFHEAKRAWVVPSYVQPLYTVYWSKGQLSQKLPDLAEIRNRVQASMKMLRPYHKRILNPAPYKVSVSDDLYRFMHELWLDNAPIGELS